MVRYGMVAHQYDGIVWHGGSAMIITTTVRSVIIIGGAISLVWLVSLLKSSQTISYVFASWNAMNTQFPNDTIFVAAHLEFVCTDFHLMIIIFTDRRKWIETTRQIFDQRIGRNCFRGHIWNEICKGRANGTLQCTGMMVGWYNDKTTLNMKGGENDEERLRGLW